MGNLLRVSFLFIAVSISLIACESTEKEITPKEIDFEEFTKMASSDDVIVLDVREPQEFEAWHFEDARLLDYNNGQFETEKASLDKSKTYLLYCHTSRRSEAAATELAAMGIKSYYLKDGYSGLNIEK